MTQPDALWIGAWRVAPELNRIERGAEVVALEPKAMALLLHLAARGGRVASRDELLGAVWPGVVVGDNALTQVVAKLRKALGDTAREPAYVQAIAKKGYRLVADVHRGGPAGPQPEPASGPSPAGRPARPRRAMLAWAAAGAATLLAAAWVVRPRAGDSAGPALGAASAKAGALPALTVLPFDELDPRAGQPDFGRAIGADLVTALSKVSGLRVLTQGTARHTLADAAEGLQYRLGGSVQQVDDRLRLHVLLTDAANGRTVWSERFDRRVTDLFAVQDELVRGILETLPVKLGEDQLQRLARRDTRNLDAWRAFVQAQQALLLRRPAANDEARAHYREAIRLDPAFARAWAGLALTYALDYQQGWTEDAPAALARAFELAETSMRMNPDMAEARWVQGFVHAQRREHERALASLDEALRLAPSYADAYALKAGIQTYLGRPAASVPLLRHALRLNPDGGSLYFLLLGRAYYFLGDAEQAQVNLNHALGRNAESLEARLYLAATLWEAGDHDAAAWQAEEVRALEPHFEARAWLANYPLTAPEPLRRLRETLAALGLASAVAPN